MSAAELLLKGCLLLITMLLASAFAEGGRVGIIIEKEHTATYLETLEGFTRKLKQSGAKYDFVQKNAFNDRTRMARLAKGFAEDEGIDAVVVLGSAAATIGCQYVRNKPMVFGGVNHPGKLGISGDNVTGVTYFISPRAVINLIHKLHPLTLRIGMLYEPADQNRASLVEVPEIEAAVRQRGWSLVKEAVRNKELIREKAKEIIDEGVDFLIIPTNRLLYANVMLIRSVTDRERVPIVSFSRQGVFSGATIGLTSDNEKLGEKMAQILIDIVENKASPKEIAWYFPESYSILINERARADLGTPIPKKIYKIATKIDAVESP